jgi:ABC-type uncharacterized transport system fused permease/ATPase subunit
MSGENGRIDYLREDIQTLRKETSNGFDRLEARFGERLEKAEERITDLETKQFRYTMVGAGVGFVAGSIVTLVIQALPFNGGI